MDAPRQVPQLLEGQLHLAVRLLHHRSRSPRILLELLLGQAQPHRERHQPRLRPVVQIPFDAAQIGRRRVHHQSAVRLQLRHPGGQQRRPQQPADQQLVHLHQTADQPGREQDEHQPDPGDGQLLRRAVQHPGPLHAGRGEGDAAAAHLEGREVHVPGERPFPQREGQQQPARAPRRDPHGGAEQRPGQVQQRVEQVPPRGAAAQQRAHPRHHPVGAAPRPHRLRLRHPQPQQRPRPAPLQMPQRPAAGQPHRQYGQAHERDEQHGAEQQRPGRVAEADARRRQPRDEIRQLAPRLPGRRGPQDEEPPGAAGGRSCGHGPSIPRRGQAG
ncbi:hypothetical protein STAL104432_31140 [Streptomyces albus]